MIWMLPALFCLFGCKDELRTYAYCIVNHVEEDKDRGYWIASCSDDSVVIFPRMIKEGDGIYYTPYTENNSMKVHGYIKKIENLVN